MMDSDQDFLGTGWQFPVEPDSAGEMEIATAERDIKESIRIILGTSKGERLMRPEFGCGIHDFVFAALNTATVTMIVTSVEEALIEWEPRIEVRNVDITTEEINSGKLLIHIEYRIRQTNTEDNLVYPFYLNE
ncbi:GPW/gp25 family protein [Haladaptatus sp. NG-SE-30]